MRKVLWLIYFVQTVQFPSPVSDKLPKGYSTGRDEGYDVGYGDGYDAGYDDGLTGVERGNKIQFDADKLKDEIKRRFNNSQYEYAKYADIIADGYKTN